MYILHCRDTDDIYVGCTSHLQRRLKQHNAGETTSTAGKHWQIIYYESYLSVDDARDREKKLKQYGKSLAMLKKRIHHSRKINSKGAG